MRAASVRQAFTFAQLESTATRAHAQLALLSPLVSLRGAIGGAEAALAAADATALAASARAMLRQGAQSDRAVRVRVVQVAADLAMAGDILQRYPTVFRRLGLGGV